MSAKHTPGPWSTCNKRSLIEIYAPDEHTVIYADGSRPSIASVWPNGDTGIAGDQEANANLIAAAPDLLAACEALRKATFDRVDEELLRVARDLADAAIAKAGGKL